MKPIHRADIYCKKLGLRNFTVFEDAGFSLVGPGINAFVGENGTGKTHAMKVLYAWMLSQTFSGALDAGFHKTLLRTMQAEEEKNLVSDPSRQGEICIEYGEVSWSTLINSKGVPAQRRIPGIERPVFIPAIEMMSHARGFGDTYDTYELDFDWTVRDIVRLLGVKSRSPAPLYQEIIKQLESTALNGSVEYEAKEDRYYLVQNGSRSSMPMVAEGLRKIATLHALLMNGSIKSGTTLFWDEPEMNLNPVLMDELVSALVQIVRTGVQIILATHSYILLEELHDACSQGEVRYFGFESVKGKTRVTSTDELPSLNPNPILLQYESLYNRQMARVAREFPAE